MSIYNSVISTVNKIFTKSHGSHWYVEDTFDHVFFGGYYGDGKFRLSKNYRRNCMIKALLKFEELNNVKSISIEEAKKYIPAVVAEYEKFRNENVEKYFGTWENMEKHYAEVRKEIESYYEKLNSNIACNIAVEEDEEVTPKSKFDFDFTEAIKKAMEKK